MNKLHLYSSSVQWIGNKGTGTDTYRSFSRDHIINSVGKPEIIGSSDPSFLGDGRRYNPEDLLVASVSSCHMLWYLHLCAEANVVVTAYIDKPVGKMQETESGSGYFLEIILNPIVTVDSDTMIEKAYALHHEANKMCFIANSVNFPIHHHAKCLAKDSLSG